MIYLLSDTHFYHKLVESYRPPNFGQKTIENIFQRVKEGDTLIHLGDFSRYVEDPPGRGLLGMWKAIPSKKILILGNHDLELKEEEFIFLEDYFDEIVDFHITLYYEMEARAYKILLTHYPASDPTREKHRDKEEKVRRLFFEGKYDLLIHGHIHGAHRGNKCKCYEEHRIPCLNVNVEYIGYRPISVEEAIRMAREKYWQLR